MGWEVVWDRVWERDGRSVGGVAMYGMAWELEGRWPVEERGWNVILKMVMGEWRRIDRGLEPDSEKTFLAMDGKCGLFCFIWQGDIASRKGTSFTMTLIHLWVPIRYPDAQLKTPLHHKVFVEIEGDVCYRCQARCHSHRLLNVEILVMAPKHLEISLSPALLTFIGLTNTVQAAASFRYCEDLSNQRLNPAAPSSNDKARS